MKIIRSIVLLLAVLLILSGCGEKELRLNKERIEQQRQEIALLGKELDELRSETVKTKVEKGLEKYILTLNIRQSHFTLDIGQHIKDEMNAIELQIPVDQDYYNSLEVGDVIDDSFRMGSFVLQGSFGSWNVTVADKEIR